MPLPINLQGDPVDFYNQMKAKKKQSPRKTDTDSDCTPEKPLERKSSTKGHNQRKKSLCSNTETFKEDNSATHVNSSDNHSPEHKVPKQEECGNSLTDQCDRNHSEPVITSNADAELSQGSKADAGAQLNNNVIVSDSSYHASDNLNSIISTEKTTSGLAR